jgi:hypothetical protein
MAIILATWEAESRKDNRRIMVQGQPGPIVQETPVFKNSQSKMEQRYGSSSRTPALQV